MRFNRFFMLAIVATIIYSIIALAAVGMFIYVAAHFINKIW
jgi:hypothetical protein